VTTVEPIIDAEVVAQLEPYRRELTGYCYRMLGSTFEAEDAVQETMVKAWKAFASFEGRSSLRAWLYRIATNVCLDHLNGRQRRARPMELGPAQEPVFANLGAPRSPETWVEPIPDARVLPLEGDPSDLVIARETIRLAFVTAIQHLPPQQRAVLILREVLRMSAKEVAALLDTSVPAVNSALQRARATLDTVDVDDDVRPATTDASDAELLTRYVDAFERYDIDALVSLIHEDATMSMPPFALWLTGPEHIARWFVGPGADCAGSRLVPVDVNGGRGFAQYRPSGPGGAHRPWALQVIDVRDGQIAGFHAFLDTARWFPLFGLPEDPSTLD